MVGQRGLVAMVAVRDQEPPVGKRLANILVLEPPEPCAFDLELRRPVGNRERRLSLVQKEDRLELRLRRAQEP